jgi:hypothetical protein
MLGETANSMTIKIIYCWFTSHDWTENDEIKLDKEKRFQSKCSRCKTDIMISEDPNNKDELWIEEL